ncbi:TyrS-associated PheT N-terminal domain-related protein TapR [Mycoplasma sp. Mirounga ES2805-ORL]|uniref:TyrS-associated PheT N-terminal domain-related protein TapR n=1 Tax=Mycoplasma sp. Mirounga ES2805-ORL TaxID=754514 RepID=UPI00197CA55D|nr:tRNA-binding protein [Mycoplasma sp. Mirounga ES2805-ORL]QSF13555.1 tRNA-binding protein [Mycoplasma sp. Mirounga ES2805-ORL]
MKWVFNLNKNFKNTSIIFVDTRIKIEKQILVENPKAKYLVFCDNNFNVNSFINYQYSTKSQLSFRTLTKCQFNKYKKDILSSKPQTNFVFGDVKFFTLGKIISRQQHPKSEKLFLLSVDFGNDELIKIVTNTTYTSEGKYFFFARPGSITSEGLEILNSEVVGVESQGMLCMPHSLGLKEDVNLFELMDWKSNELDKHLGEEIMIS